MPHYSPHYSRLPVQSRSERRLHLVKSEAHAELADPASAVFTDLRVAPGVVVPAVEPLNETRRLMQLAGVRMAFVVDADGGVVGLVTAADLQGELPVRVAGLRGLAQRDLAAVDVMTPVAEWITIDVARLASARVGDIAETFRAAGQRYLIVTETETVIGAGSALAVRGLFSANRVERALGHTIAIELRSRSFAELAAALAHN